MVIQILISKWLAIFSIQVREKAKLDSRRPAVIQWSLRFSADVVLSRTRRVSTLCNFHTFNSGYVSIKKKLPC